LRSWRRDCEREYRREQAGMQIIERRYPPGDERGTMRSTN
jgi:hypothetical protein